MTEPMITAAELARRLNVHRASIYRMTARNVFPPSAVLRVDGLVRYDWPQIREALTTTGGAR